MSDIIDFPKQRNEEGYVPHDEISEGLEALTKSVHKIVKSSDATAGAIDPVAYELNAHINAMRRIMAEIAPETEGTET